MKNEENNIIYTAKDIEQYLAGKLTPLQMHTMEKAALNDLLLAEAIDGYSSVNLEEWKTQLALLKDKFENSNSKTSVIVLPKRSNNWIKIAAAVLLISGTATISYLFISKKEKKQIAQNTKNITITDSNALQFKIPEESIVKTSPKNDLPAVNKISEQTITDKNNAGLTETIQPDSNFVYPPARQAASVFAKENKRDMLEEDAKNNSIPSASAAPVYNYNNEQKNARGNNSLSSNTNTGVINNAEYSKAKPLAEKNNQLFYKKELQLNNSFIAQVVSADNTPLPFANISVKSENFGTYADVKGNFRLVSTDSIITVEIKAVGYQTKSHMLQSNLAQNKIVLNEADFTLKETTVIGNGTGIKSKFSRSATLLKDSIVNVEPADGWDNYNTYVNNNIEIPDNILKNDLHGMVELSFDVKSNGSITNIKINKSLCNDCDEAAKRLIEQGPQWKVKNGKKGKGKVTVQF
jgi:hypothetical protein